MKDVLNKGVRGIENIQKYFEELGLIDPNNPNANAQILNHCPGINGLEHSKNILENGLFISAEEKNKHGISIESNAEVSSGICSTNTVLNDKNTNLMDFVTGCGVFSLSQTKKENVSMSIVSAIPQELEGIYLGKIRQMSNNRVKGSVLDDLKMGVIPTEFIVGVFYVNPEKHNAAFKVNPKFYALNEKNKEVAVNYIKGLLKNDEFVGDFINEETRKDSALYNIIKQSTDYKNQNKDHFHKVVQSFKESMPYIAEKISEIESELLEINVENMMGSLNSSELKTNKEDIINSETDEFEELRKLLNSDKVEDNYDNESEFGLGL